MNPGEWNLSGIRPQNHPVRRMAAAASIFANKDRLPRMSSEGDARRRVDGAIRALLEVGRGGFWSRRFTFASRRQDSESSLIGTERASAILTNVLVPFAIASGASNDDCGKILNLLPPEHDNGIIRRTAFLLLGRDCNPRMYHTALRQQGLIQIFNDFCLNDRSGCRDCPLPLALEQWHDEGSSEPDISTRC